MLRYLIGLKNSRHFFIQSELEPKPIIPRTSFPALSVINSSASQPCLFPRTVTHRHSLFLHCPTPCFSGSSSLAFSFRYRHQCNAWRALLSIHSVSNPCPPSSLCLFADSFHVRTLAHLFISHSHRSIGFFLCSCKTKQCALFQEHSQWGRDLAC